MDANQINDLRKRVLEKAPVTKEELAEAVKAMCGERISAAAAADKPKKGGKAKATDVNLEDLL